MTVYNRKMFRKGGVSKGTGIMASGPELMKRFNVGGMARQFEPNYVGAPGQVFFNQSTTPFTQVSDELSKIAKQTSGIGGKSISQIGLSPSMTMLYGNQLATPGEKNPRSRRTDAMLKREQEVFRKGIASQLDTFEDPRASQKGAQTFTTGVKIDSGIPKNEALKIIAADTNIKTDDPKDQFIDDTTTKTSFINEDPNIKYDINKKNKDLLEKKNEKKEDLSFKPKKVTVDKDGLEVGTANDVKKELAKKENNKTEAPGKKKAVDESANTLKISFSSDFTNDKDKGNALSNYMKKFSDYEGRNLNMGDLEELASKTTGYDPNNPDKSNEQRKDAFFMGLIRAGLAIASGQSDDVFTNLAKGLAFGVEAYAKDIDTLNKNEKEDRKEYYRSLRELVKDDKSAIAAEKALAAQIDGNNASLVAKIGIADAQIKSREEIAKMSHDLKVMEFVNRNKIDLAELDLEAEKVNSLNAYRTAIINKDTDQFNKNYDLNNKKFNELVKQNDQKMKQFNISSTIKLLDEDSKTALSIFGGVERDASGMITSIELPDEGQNFVKKLALLSKVKSTNTTDLMRKVTATAASNMAGTVDLSGLNEADKLNAALIWESQYKDIYQDTFNIKDEVTKTLLPQDNAQVQAIQKSIIDNYKKQIGGFKNKAIVLK